jgi:hypothetical protein
MEVLETKFIFRVTVGFLDASPAVPRSGSGINQDVASGEEGVLACGPLCIHENRSWWKREYILDSKRHKKNTKRKETHDDNTDDVPVLSKRKIIIQRINTHTNFAREFVHIRDWKTNQGSHLNISRRSNLGLSLCPLFPEHVLFFNTKISLTASFTSATNIKSLKNTYKGKTARWPI